MPEMNGATLTLKDPATGQVVEYEIVRSGTMKEFRTLRSAHEAVSDELENRQRRSGTQAARGGRGRQGRECLDRRNEGAPGRPGRQDRGAQKRPG
jgi:hypothetical protein